jgi:predicted metalloprotease
MRWRNLGESTHVEDRRGQSSGFRGVPVRGKAGVVVLLVVLVAGYYGVDLTPLLFGESSTVVSSGEPYRPSEQEQEAALFTSVALKTTEDAWEQIFRQAGSAYSPPNLVLYSGATQTTCGTGQSAMGPFYCPNDQTVYIDLSFYQDMKKRLGGGDFAQGYVIAHEVGHHVQHLLGIDQKVRQAQSRASQAEGNRLSVRLELQADCFAGVWDAPRRTGVFWSPATWRPLYTRPKPSATTACNGKTRAGWCRTASPTAPHSSATCGSSAASRLAIPMCAIPFPAPTRAD